MCPSLEDMHVEMMQCLGLASEQFLLVGSIKNNNNIGHDGCNGAFIEIDGVHLTILHFLCVLETYHDRMLKTFLNYFTHLL